MHPIIIYRLYVATNLLQVSELTAISKKYIGLCTLILIKLSDPFRFSVFALLFPSFPFLFLFRFFVFLFVS